MSFEGKPLSLAHFFEIVDCGLTIVTRWMNRVATIICGLLAGASLVVMLLQVLYRYVLESPLVWSEEVVRYLLVWMSFLGAGLAAGERLHPKMDFFLRRLPARSRETVEIVSTVLILVFLVLFIFVSFDLVKYNASYRSLGAGIPQSWPRLALPVGGMVLAVNVLQHCMQDLTNSTNQEDGGI